MVYAPCQICNFCLQRRASDWAIRLHHHLKANINGYFLTLTYDQEHLPHVGNTYGRFVRPSLHRKHLAQFHKLVKQYQNRLLRKLWKREGWTADIIHLTLHTAYKVSYYAAPEYGSRTQRPHYHTLLFNIHPKVIRDIVARGKVWKHGHVHLGNIADASIMYTTKYVIDRGEEWNDPTDNREKGKAMMSKGLGKTYLSKEMIAWHREDTRFYTIINGIKKGLPRYYKDQIFTKAQRERLEEHFKQLSAQKQQEELAQLALVHPRPDIYREAIREQAYHKIRRSSTKTKRNSL